MGPMVSAAVGGRIEGGSAGIKTAVVSTKSVGARLGPLLRVKPESEQPGESKPAAAKTAMEVRFIGA